MTLKFRFGTPLIVFNCSLVFRRCFPVNLTLFHFLAYTTVTFNALVLVNRCQSVAKCFPSNSIIINWPLCKIRPQTQTSTFVETHFNLSSISSNHFQLLSTLHAATMAAATRQSEKEEERKPCQTEWKSASVFIIKTLSTVNFSCLIEYDFSMFLFRSKWNSTICLTQCYSSSLLPFLFSRTLSLIYVNCVSGYIIMRVCDGCLHQASTSLNAFNSSAIFIKFKTIPFHSMNFVRPKHFFFFRPNSRSLRKNTNNWPVAMNFPDILIWQFFTCWEEKSNQMTHRENKRKKKWNKKCEKFVWLISFIFECDFLVKFSRKITRTNNKLFQIEKNEMFFPLANLEQNEWNEVKKKSWTYSSLYFVPFYLTFDYRFAFG